MKKIFLFVILTSWFSNYFGQITTTVNPTIAQLTQKLSGNGITITGLTKTCPTDAYALYSGGTGVLSNLSSGILLTTGDATDVSSTGLFDTDNLAPGSQLGDNLDLSGSGSQDACYIKFLITPSCNTLSVNYIFASAEYSDFVNATFNDVFGFVIDGPNPSGGNYNQTNIALVPGTSLPVSINNVNNGVGLAAFGFPPSGPCKNCAYFQDAPAGIGYGGSTTVLTASTAVTPCQQYTMTIGVWDVGDGSYDSGVFLDVNGLSCVGSPTITATVNPTVICGPQTVTLTASGAAATGSYTWAAPASGGLTSTTGTVVTANPTAATTYSLLYSDVNTCPGFPIIKTTTLSFSVTPSFPVTQSPAGSLCPGQSATLTANGGAGTYSWVPSAGLVTTTGSVVVTTPTATTTYTVTKTSGSCTSFSVITVNITSASVAITPSLSTICLGQSVNLSASGAGPFVWSATSGTNPPSVGNVTVTPSSTTTYSVLSGTGTCTASAVATVSISTIPSINITPSVSAICSGSSQTLTATGAGPFVWTASSGAIIPAAATVVVSPTASTTYTVLSGTGACTATAVASVSITPVSPISITPSVSSICSGSSQTLTASGIGPFVWTASDGSTPAALASIVVTPTATTTYTVLSGTGTCTTTAIATVSILSTASISITPSNTIICNGGSTSLAVVGSTGPFVWSASSGINPSATGTVVVTPTTTTTYTVLSGTGTCTASAVATVSVAPTLTLTITPTSSAICNGSGTNLTASGATSYTWIPGFSTSPTLSVTPTTTTTYTLIGTDGVCVSSTATTISVTSLTVTVNSSSPIYCIGAPQVTLTASGATSYSWSPATSLSATNGVIVTATPSATQIYSVTGTSNGCSSSAPISITVPPLRTMSVTSSNSIICVGNSSTLTATGATTYTWDNGATTATTVVSPNTTTSYTVGGQTSQGCFVIPAVITVSVLPTINPILVSSSPTVCLTQSVTISTSPVTSGLTYTWLPTNAIQGANNTASIVAVPPSTATVIYTVTISNGVCIGTTTTQIAVRVKPDILNIKTLNNDTICVGGCVTFSASTTGSQPIAYQWFYQTGIGTSSVGITPEACYPSAGSFSVVATASNTCGFDTLIKTNFVTVFDLPVVIVGGDTTINIGESAEIFATGGLNYSWSPNINGSIACPSCSITSVSPTLTTEYIVVVSNSQYCKVQDTVTVIVDINCGDFFIPNVFSPNGDGLNDMINVHGRCITTFNLQIFNRWGEKVFETSSLSESWDGTFRGQKLDTGVFVYKADGISIDGQEFKLKGNITLIR